jgi:glycosyltransferase involved in cell wall biosynthesis
VTATSQRNSLGPRFSIVVPAYQAEATLAETLDAVNAQTLDDWECIVVDDGSTDSTKEIASQYAARDPRIRVLSQPNQGTAGAYNTGVRAARGEYIVICSADDILVSEHLRRMSAFVQREPSFDIYSTNGYFWWPGESEELVYRDLEGGKDRSDSLADVISRCFYSVGATYRRSLFSEVGGYHVGVYGEDYDFWLRAMARGARHRYLPEALSRHRVSASRKSAQHEAVYRSDIQLLTDLSASQSLTDLEMRAIERAIGDRQRLLTLATGGGGVILRMRRAVKRWLIAVFGDARAEGIARAVKRLIGEVERKGR